MHYHLCDITCGKLLGYCETPNPILTTNLAACVCVSVCVCAKFDQFLPGRSHFDSKRPEFFFRIATFPSATFGPLFAFHCPLFVTKNNNLDGKRHASPHAGTGATFTGRVIVRARDNIH